MKITGFRGKTLLGQTQKSCGSVTRALIKTKIGGETNPKTLEWKCLVKGAKIIQIQWCSEPVGLPLRQAQEEMKLVTSQEPGNARGCTSEEGT